MVDNDTLLRQVAEGDAGALEELVECNMGLVKSVALRFRDRGTEYEDLVQIGAIGLLRAARSFDFSFGCMFSTYAVPLIIGEIRRHLRDDGIIKVSRTIRTRAVHLMREREQFTRREGREPTVGELGELTGYTAEEIVTALDAAGPVRSLSETVGGEDGAPLECFIADPDAPPGSAHRSYCPGAGHPSPLPRSAADHTAALLPSAFSAAGGKCAGAVAGEGLPRGEEDPGAFA